VSEKPLAMPNGTTFTEPVVVAEERRIPGARPDEPNRRTALWIAAGLAVVTFAVYFRTLHNGFISYDDYDYITNNPLVRGGLSWQGIAQAFTSFDQSNWFPMEWISLMATSQFFGLGPAAYHLTNLALHIANVILFFLLLQKATGKVARAGVVAVLFAVFPLNVEAVAWATERKSVLSVFFLLLALGAYGWYVRKPGIARYFAIAAPFALGLMTKAWLITFPFALLLLDYWPLERFGGDDATMTGYARESKASFSWLVAEKIPLFLMSFLSTLIGIHAARMGDALSISAAHAPLSLRVENALWSYLAYILKGIWPTRLAIIYPFPQHFLPVWRLAAAGIFLVGVTALVLRARTTRYLLVGWLWYLGVLFPVIGLIQTGTQSMADRWAYISFWGLFVAVVWDLADWAAQLRIPRATLGVLAAAVLVAYGGAAYVQTGYWRDSFTLYAHAIQVTRDNGPVRVNLGVEYERLGRPDLALPQYRQAVADMPNLGVAHFNLARLLDNRQQPIEAAAQYHLAIANTGVAREIGDAHVGLGKIYAEMNLPAKATEEFTAALAANPGDVYALLDRGMIEFRQGDLEAARKDFSQSIEITPTPMTWYTLGVILEDEKNIPAAIQAYEAALQMNPNLQQAQAHLQELRQQPSH
jgi:protein O-mannosyl-transferase